MLKLKVLFSITTVRASLLLVSFALFAFTDSEYFRRNFDFGRILYQYETNGPSSSYRSRLGIEIEGYYTEKRATDGKVSLTAYKDLIDLSQTTLESQGYEPLYHADQSKKEHKEGATGLFFTRTNDDHANEKRLLFISDISIFHSPGTTPVEIVSPILDGAADLSAFLSVIDSAVKERAFTAEPLNSGTHFHFDFGNPQREEILILTIVLEKLLPEIKAAFSVQDSRTQTFAMGYSAVDFESLVGFTKSVVPLRKTSKLNVHRHRATNWHSLEKHGTFEFRLFNSTTDPNLLSIQADLIAKIVKAVRLRDPKLIELLKTPDLKGLTLEATTRALDCLMADEGIRDYAQRTSAKDVQHSLRIQDKLAPQKAFSSARTLNISDFLNSPLVRPMGAHRPQQLTTPSYNTVMSNRLQSNETVHYSSVTMSFNPPQRSANRCIEFYK